MLRNGKRDVKFTCAREVISMLPIGGIPRAGDLNLARPP
jgi:hypothetical protein